MAKHHIFAMEQGATAVVIRLLHNLIHSSRRVTNRSWGVLGSPAAAVTRCSSTYASGHWLYSGFRGEANLSILPHANFYIGDVSPFVAPSHELYGAGWYGF